MDNTLENTNKDTREVELRIIDAVINGLYACGYHCVIVYGYEARTFRSEIAACAFMRGFVEDQLNVDLLCYSGGDAGLVRLELGAGYDVIADYSDILEIALTPAFAIIATGDMAVGDEFAGKINDILNTTLENAIVDVFTKIGEKNVASAQALSGALTEAVDGLKAGMKAERDPSPEKPEDGMVERYLVFAGEHDYAQGGWQDYKGSYPTPEDARKVCEEHVPNCEDMSDENNAWSWYRIVDIDTGDIIEERGRPFGVICKKDGRDV